MQTRFAALGCALALFVAASGCGTTEPGAPDAGCVPTDDGNPCTEDLCESGQPTKRNLAAGSACAAGVCDGNGACVECVTDTDCDGGDICNEATKACVPPTCTDAEKNGTETGVDCGGSCAPTRTCADGAGCVAGADCASGVCDTAGTCAAPSCGDGTRQGSEACDDGNKTNGDGCDDGTSGNCRPTGCGNGTVTGTEVCDDGNAVDSDGCDNNCTPTACGNGVISSAETCDDSDTSPGDGCSATCAVEAGFTCSMVPSVCVPTCGDGQIVSTEACDDPAPAEDGDGCSGTCTVETGFTCAGSPSTCAAVCGDGLIVGAEACDDPAPAENGDGCSATCTVETGFTCAGVPSVCTTTCGDGTRAGTEACDDAPPAEDGDGCSATCTVETGFTCTGSPSACTTTCGDGIRGGTEACDDAPPAEDGDGCSATCTVETGFTCTGSPSACTTTCGDGVIAGAEACDDAPPADDGDGCSAICSIETGYQCSGQPSVCVLTCGNGVVESGEMCDDGASADGDGCSSACLAETGWSCTGAPSVCATTCGDGIVAGVESCDDAPPAENGDGCSATCGVESGYTCTGSPSSCATTCGDAVRAGGEACDDGNLTNDDGCSSTCVIECGDGILSTANEECDDSARVDGDGCSATCKVEITCPAGSTAVTVTNRTELAIPDNTPAGVFSPATVATVGRVDKAVVFLGSLPHEFDSDLDLYLVGPTGLQRDLSTDNGGSGLDYSQTYLDDAAATAVTAGTSPFTGAFRPEQSLTTTAGTDFSSTRATGTWNLRLVDDASGDTGSLKEWTLGLCVNTTATFCGDGIVNGAEECDDGNVTNTDACANSCALVDGCGDGNIDGAELCDDDNLTSGDGCSATCQPEIICPTGQTPVIITDSTSASIPDNTSVGVNRSAAVATAGAVTRVALLVSSLSHTNDADVDMFLVAPNGLRRELSTDNGGTGDNYRGTRFEDGVATAITAGSAPFSGTFRSEQTLSSTPSVDFRSLNAAGTWQLHVADDLAANTGSIDSWTLMLCVDAAAPACGDGVRNGSEECDDGNFVGTDACSNSCTIVDGCGDGNIDGAELCDDDNTASDDGCSATCQPEINCPAGQTPVILTNNNTASIPDNNAAGVSSSTTVPTTGAVTRVAVLITSLTHTNDADVDMFLVAPNGVRRELSTDNGGTGDNYRGTRFDDGAATPITTGTVPFTGTFRPEQSLNTTAGLDFRALNAAGTWQLNVADDLATNTGSIDSWTLALCVDTAATYCGDSITNGGEECDDGNTNNVDSCGNTCLIADGCGDGNLDSGEECDDNNVVSGDGCSAVCALDISCGSGEQAVIVRNNTASPLLDNAGGSHRSLVSKIAIPTVGAVRKVHAFINITHPATADLDVYVGSPFGVERTLTDDNAGVNYTATLFSDGAATPITAGTAPYVGTFRAENTLSDANGFVNQWAQGDWSLRVTDDTTGNTGTLQSWAIALCVDTTVTAPVCGNGFVEPGETCDDGNSVSGDGCGVCQVELGCGAGQTAVFVSALGRGQLIEDNVTSGTSSTVTVANVGVVRRATVVVGSLSHLFLGDVDMTLASPMGTVLDITSDNGSSGDHLVSTIFDDAAPTAISAAGTVGPFRGRFRPEQALSTVNAEAATGNWTLRATDDASIDSGLLGGWVLGLCVE